MAKILLVEDDISLRDVYYARLQAEGYELAVASNGEEALAMAVKEQPDLIILDIMMPRISGFDVLDIIRTTPKIAHTKVIMMTALGSPEDRERGEKLGVDRYLVKSQVTLEDVVATIKKVLQTPSVASNEAIVGAPQNDQTNSQLNQDTNTGTQTPTTDPQPPTQSPGTPQTPTE